MGNTFSTKPTNKVKVLTEEVNDFSANITSNVVMEASQNVIVNQEQNIVIRDSSFTNCDMSVSQQANVMATQIATFKALFSSPKQVLNKLVNGPNSILGKMMASNSPVAKEFLNTTKSVIGKNTDADLRQYISNTIKLNINQNAIMRATQNTILNQSQNVLLQGIKCVDGKLNIKQDAVVNAAQNVMFTLIADSIGSDPNMRRALRTFNGDYDKGVLDSDIEEGVKIPDACMSDKIPPTTTPTCPPCETCPECPDLKCDLKTPTCDDYILSAKIFYGIAITLFIMIILAIILK